MTDLQQLSHGLARHCHRTLGGSAGFVDTENACWFFAEPALFPELEHLEALINSYATRLGNLALDLSACHFGEQNALLTYRTSESVLEVEITTLDDQVAVVLQLNPAGSRKA